MTKKTTLLFVTKSPSHALSRHALRYAKAFLDEKAVVNSASNLKVFFYSDGAETANALRWQSADQFNVTQAWQELAQSHNVALKVCVSTALARGVSDKDNAMRHGLGSDNIAKGFELVGLSELVMLIDEANLIQF